jgi:hypothetical protein
MFDEGPGSRPGRFVHDYSRKSQLQPEVAASLQGSISRSSISTENFFA